MAVASSTKVDLHLRYDRAKNCCEVLFRNEDGALLWAAQISRDIDDMKYGLIPIVAAMAGLAPLTTQAEEFRRDLSETRACLEGKPSCVKRVVRRMHRRFNRLARRCDHDSIFSLFYLRTTEVFKDTLTAIGYDDPASVIREDALFADYYFRAFDAYHTGFGDVPPAWQVAFDAAQQRTVTSAGNSLLGFNAHINRDLPFTLYELYLQGAPVSERDHFLVNDFLAQVDVTDEVIERFDPDYPVDGDSSFVFEWRLIAWLNYQRLIRATNAAEVAAISAEIEAYAEGIAQFILQIASYPPGETSADRDAHCRRNRRWW